ncbi:putative tudor domain protein [Trichinella spiralis]|uniref:putative tudor domain protein n=1 Tax=Trichinella spiralis TaxID=6334 RepID=UPI0001EFB26A|nr:putative tudor domain protein [Trichinella spiralis]
MDSASDTLYNYEIATYYKEQEEFLNDSTFGTPLIEHARFQAVVTNWSTPDHFHQTDMDRKMDVFYNETKHLPNVNFESMTKINAVGLPVAVLINQKWTRGIITCKVDNSFRILHVDVGIQTIEQLDRIRPLYCQFAELPPLAFKCYLRDLKHGVLNEYIMQKLDRVMVKDKEFDCEISSWDKISSLPVKMYELGSSVDVIDVHLSSYFKKQQRRLAQRQRDLEQQKQRQKWYVESESDESM